MAQQIASTFGVLSTLKYWFAGIRVYIAIGTILATIATLWWSSSVYGDSTLSLIRSQEVFGWVSVIFIFIAISIGPFYALFSSAPGKSLMFDARRLLGVSAAWFALLHTSLVYFGLFGAPNIFELSDTYRYAFLLGTAALLILLAMAFTSFDKAFRSLGIWWFRIHRLVYAAGLMILLHIFLIGVHATSPVVLITTAMAVTALLVMHIWLSFVRQRPTFWQLVTICYSAVFLLAIMNYGLSQYLGYNIVDSWHGSGGHIK